MQALVPQHWAAVQGSCPCDPAMCIDMFWGVGHRLIELLTVHADHTQMLYELLDDYLADAMPGMKKIMLARVVPGSG